MAHNSIQFASCFLLLAIAMNPVDHDPMPVADEESGCAAAAALSVVVDEEVAFSCKRVGDFVRVRVAAPAEGARKPVIILAILDNSGSMAESAGTMPGAESVVFTRMDLVKHAVKTIAALLGPADRLGIVSFSTDARVALEPICMTDEGRARVDAALSTIHPDANTNIFAGIRQAAALANKDAFADANIVAMLLTDGFPNVNPPRGIVPTLQNGGSGLLRPWTLSTFGFGYSLDSALLSEIAEWGGGSFGFIPDCSMVGTVFINAIAHILSLAHRGTSYTLSYGGQSQTHTTGPIAFGQPRTFLHRLGGDVVVRCEGREWAVGTVGTAVDAEDVGSLARQDLLDTLDAVLARCKAGGVGAAQELLEAFYERHRGSTNRDVQAFCKDVSPIAGEEGQVHMAPSYFAKWGEHYLRAYRRAHALQQCMNFKDAGLQIYGGDMFHRLQDEGDRHFCTLPPPKATVRGGGAGAAAAPTAPINMSLFVNASAGCFAGETLIRLADGTSQPIADLNPGDLVATPTGNAVIRALVTCRSQLRGQPMTQLGDLWITPWHPIRLNGEWKFPIDIAGFVDRPLQVVYNLVLDSGHIVYANGYEACTLAHGFTDSPVIQHDFFGTNRVVEDLAQVAGWDVGRPTFRNLVAIRDTATGVICGWRDLPF